MDSTPAPEVANTHNDERLRNAALQERTMADEVLEAREKLRQAAAYLDVWMAGMTPLVGTEPQGDETTTELARLVRVGRIVSGLVTEASTHTAEGQRLSVRDWLRAQESDGR